MSLKESFEWAKIPDDLPRENLVLITAKTTQPTDHLWDKDNAIRIFKPEELHEAGRSLSRRFIGLNHIEGDNGLIKLSASEKALTRMDFAYTVDSQYNPLTEAVEALAYLPTPYILLIREGKIVKPSVEFRARNERREGNKIYFEGITFDRIDLLYGRTAGDQNTGFKFIESSPNGKTLYLEAQFGGLGSSLPPTATDVTVNKATQVQDAFNLPIDAPLVNKIYFECPSCKSRYEYDPTKKEWGPYCHQEAMKESVPDEKDKKLKELNDKLTEATTKITTQEKTLQDNHIAIENLQKNAKDFDKSKKEAVDQAVKQATIVLKTKVESVLPNRSFGWEEGQLADITKKVRDALNGK